MIDILRQINKEKNLIDQELEQKDERLEFYRAFFKNSSCTTLNDAISANHCDLAIAIILNLSPHLSVEDVKEVVYGNEDIFANLNFQAISDITRLIDYFAHDHTLYRKTKKMLLENSGNRLTNMFKQEKEVAAMIKELTDHMGTTPKDFIAFIDLFIEEPQTVVLALSTVSTLREIEEEKEFHYFMINEIAQEEHSRKVKGKVQDKWVSERIRDDYNIANLLKPITDARNEYHQLEQVQRNKIRNLSRAKTEYEKLEKELYKAIQAGEVRNIESLIRKIPSAEIRLSVLKLVYSHNKEIYDRLSNEYQQLAANDSSHYQVLLAKYGISPDTYEVGTVMTNSIEELEKILDLASKLKLTKPQELLRIAQNSNLETLENILSLAEKGIITSDLIKNHQLILNPETKDYEDFMRNLALISNKRLNPHMFTQSEEILTISHQRFQESIQTLETYDLNSNLRTGMNLSFLGSENLNTAIDTLLELGYENNLEENLELLNYKDRFNRLRILKSLNISVSSTQELLDVLSSDKFYVPDNEITKYIYDATSYNLPKDIVIIEEAKKKVSDISKLSEYSYTSRTYSFDGILISKNRVHKNLSTISSTSKVQSRLLYGVLKGTILTDEEISKVRGVLIPEKTTKVVKEKK